MSTSPHSFPKLPRGPDVLGELLHSLSQPLTSLRCSLELSIEEVAEQQQESVSVALQQTEKVIGMIQLMREYLDAERPGPETYSVGWRRQCGA
jgi:signal transduction histidine kinase